MESATITKVTLRQEKLRSGKLSLYLDFYPPIWNPHIKKMSRREFLGRYLFGNPKDMFELDYNEEIMLKARGIRATRELAIINEEFGFLDRTKETRRLSGIFRGKDKGEVSEMGDCLQTLQGLLQWSLSDERCYHRSLQRLPFLYPQNSGQAIREYHITKLCRGILVYIPRPVENSV